MKYRNIVITLQLFFAAILFFFSVPQPLGAQAFPPLDPSQKAYEYARRIAVTDVPWLDLAEASLWASSVLAGPGAEEKAASYLNSIKTAAAELASSALPQAPRERGEAVLAFLHKKFLKSYSEYQTRVDEVFVTGRYNCVSSALLYMVLCKSLGLEVEGVMTRDHAFVLVKAGTETIDVETTNLYGFDPGNRKEFQDAFGKTTGFAYVPARNYRDRITISPAELVSLILSNRIAVLERGNRYADAVPLAINRAVLLSPGIGNGSSQNGSQNRADFFEDPQKELTGKLINLGAYYIRNGKEDDAIAWAAYAGARFPDTENPAALSRWQELIKAAVNNKLVKLIRAKKTPDAREALAAAKEKLSDVNYYELDILVLEAEVADRVNSIRREGDAGKALDFIAQNWERLPHARREEMRYTAILAEADRLGKARDWQGGIRYLAGAIELYGSNARLQGVYSTMRQNRVSELHNEFAVIFNKRDYSGAKASVEKSLLEFPGDKQLLQDLVLAEKALMQQ